jgi:hypothetical protein
MTFDDDRRRHLRDLELAQLILHQSGPMRRLNRLYAELLLASDPVRGRSYDSDSHRHPFDQPPPHLRNARLRSVLENIDRLITNAADAIAGAAFGDPVDYSQPRDICPNCGLRTDLGRRRRDGRKFQAAVNTLDTAIPKGRTVPATVAHDVAQHLDVSVRTVERAADRLSIRKFQRDGQWWWQR